jgi:predicted DNA-binding transcriptional regulator AlpA
MQDKFLNSWKEVAQYVGRSARTIQRWERYLGFPVHRPAGRRKSAVIAVPTEIDEWIKKAPVIRAQRMI